MISLVMDILRQTLYHAVHTRARPTLRTFPTKSLTTQTLSLSTLCFINWMRPTPPL